MSNYFDNQKRWSWTCDGKSVKVETDHGDHTHSVDITNVTIGDMCDKDKSGKDKSDKIMGDAHRAASHDKK